MKSMFFDMTVILDLFFHEFQRESRKERQLLPGNQIITSFRNLLSISPAVLAPSPLSFNALSPVTVIDLSLAENATDNPDGGNMTDVHEH